MKVYGETQRAKGTKHILFQVLVSFLTGNSQNVCGPNHHSCVDIDEVTACTPSYGHVSCQYLTNYLSVSSQYLSVCVSICQYLSSMYMHLSICAFILSAISEPGGSKFD